MSKEPETKSVQELVKEVNSGLTTLKSELESLKKGQEKSVEVETKLDKITDSVTKAAEQLQELDRKQKAMDAAMNRIDQLGDQGKATPERVRESKAAFKEYMLKGPDALSGTKFKSTAEGLEIRGMATDNNANGGYLVIPEMADFLVQRLFETSPIRSLARVMQTASKSMEVIIDDDEAAARWVGEGASGGETNTPAVGKLTITAHKLEAEPKVTTEMLEDPFLDVESWLQGKVADKFGRLENTAFVQGTGLGQPRGFMTLPAWAVAGTYERNKIEQVNLGGASDVTADGLISLQASLKEVYQGNATWLMKRASYGNVLKLKGADNYFFSTTLLKDGNTQLQLLGRPVVYADDMAAIASSALSVAYGDFSVGYTILDRVGINVLRDPFTGKGFVKFYTTKRTGGEVTNFEAIKIGKIST